MKISTAYRVVLFISANLFIWHLGFAQKASRHFIDSTLAANDTTFRSTTHILYIINGVPYDTSELESTLSNFESKHLLDAMFLDVKHYPFYGNAAIIVFAHNQKSKFKRKMWKAAQRLYSDNSDTPILLIDNSVVDPINSKRMFQTLRLKDIMYIDTTQRGNKNQIRV